LDYARPFPVQRIPELRATILVFLVKALYLEADPVDPDVENNHIIAERMFDTVKSRVLMNKLLIVKEFWNFLKVRKRWWLIPIVCLLLMLCAILAGANGSSIAPFI